MPETALHPPVPEFKYWAFISYSQRDKPWSDWLHHAIETYRVPARLAGRDSRDGAFPKRLFPVFRDREELSTSASLDSNIRDALGQSRCLIVVCSPHAAASRWVNEEIRTFKALGREDRILPVIVGGEPNAAEKSDAGLLECFPPALRYRVGADGQLTSDPRDPVAADARPGKDSRKDVRLKIVAGLLGVGLDELRQRDRARQRRRVLAAAAIALVWTGVIATGLFLQDRAKKQEIAQRIAAAETQKRHELDRQLAASYKTRAEKLVEQSDFAAAASYFAASNQLNASPASRDAALLHLRRFVLPRRIVSHDVEIVSAGFSPDSSKFLTMNAAGKVRVWDTASGARVCEFAVDTDTYMFRSARFTRDGTRIFTTAENARLWNANTGKPLAPAIPFREERRVGVGVTEIDGVRAAALDPDEQHVILVWGDGESQVWDARTSKPLGPKAAHAADSTDPTVARLSQMFSPDRKVQVYAPGDRPPQLYRSFPDEPIGSPITADGNVMAMAFSPNSEIFATTAFNGNVRVWNARTGESQGAPMAHPAPVSSVEFSADSAFILTAAGDAAYLWRGKGLEMIMPNAGEVTAAGISPDGAHILTATKEGAASVWKVADRRFWPATIVTDEWDRAVVMSLSPDATRLFVRRQPTRHVRGLIAQGMVLEPQEEPGSIRVWDVATRQPLWPVVPFDGEIKAVAFSPDGLLVATLGQTPIPRDRPYGFGEWVPHTLTAQLWNAKTGASVGAAFRLPEGESGGDSETPGIVLLFSPDSARLLLIHNTDVRLNGSRDLTWQLQLQLLDARTGQPAGPALAVAGEQIGSAVWLKSGDAVLAGRTGAMRWRPGATVFPPQPFIAQENLVAVAVSPDERTLLLATRHDTRLWDLRTREPIGAAMPRESYTEVHEALFSPDGRLAVTFDGGIVRLWDAHTGGPVGAPIEVSSNPDFSDGPRFASATRLLAPVRMRGITDVDLSWLLREVAPDVLLKESQLFTRREVTQAGDVVLISPARWDALRHQLAR